MKKNLAGKMICIVDGDSYIRSNLAGALRAEGATVHEIEDGEEALHLDLNQPLSLIMLDILIPHLEGIYFLRTVRLDSRGKNIPVIVFTSISATDPSLIRLIAELKPLHYFIKGNISIPELMTTIRETLVPVDI